VGPIESLSGSRRLAWASPLAGAAKELWVDYRDKSVKALLRDPQRYEPSAAF
jgi:hypothetical protein